MVAWAKEASEIDAKIVSVNRVIKIAPRSNRNQRKLEYRCGFLRLLLLSSLNRHA